MALLFHLSDLHLLGHPREQASILRSLVGAVEGERRFRGRRADLLCLTGDVFDSGAVALDRAADVFAELLDALHDALGGQVPTVVVPGNHDTRRAGVLAPSSDRLFRRLARAVEGRAWVHFGGPFLAEVLPPEFHGLPLWVVAYDSTHLPGGAVGAGGVLRQEDLLRAAAIIDGHHPDWPVLFLLHHHLIPTPLTDLGPIDTASVPRALRWVVEHAMPALVSNGDREELFMTALGAGTALSTLHTLRRAVLVLHGHKHYATTRLLSGTREDQGDVLIVSAGSGGTAQAWRPSRQQQRADVARLWPSFNVIELDADGVEVDQVAFPWRQRDVEAVRRRPMVRAGRALHRWHAQPFRDLAAIEPGPRLDANEVRFRLTPSTAHGGERWDLAVARRIRFAASSPAERYVETIGGSSGAALELGRGTERIDAGSGLPAQLRVDTAGQATYRLVGGVARTAAEERRLAGRAATPFGRLELMNRYQCASAELSAHGLQGAERTAFGSATDLGTGLERPVPVRVEDGAAFLTVTSCPPRTLLRLYWLLQDDQVPSLTSDLPPPVETPAEAEGDVPPPAQERDVG